MADFSLASSSLGREVTTSPMSNRRLPSGSTLGTFQVLFSPLPPLVRDVPRAVFPGSVAARTGAPTSNEKRVESAGRAR